MYGNKRKGSRAKTCSRSSLRHHRPTSGAQLSFLIYSTVPKRRPLLYGADAVLIYTQAHTARLPGQVQQRATAHTNNSDAKCVCIVTVCVDMQLSCRPCCCCCYSTCAIIKKTMHTIDWGRLVPPVFFPYHPFLYMYDAPRPTPIHHSCNASAILLRVRVYTAVFDLSFLYSLSLSLISISVARIAYDVGWVGRRNLGPSSGMIDISTCLRWIDGLVLVRISSSFYMPTRTWWTAASTVNLFWETSQRQKCLEKSWIVSDTRQRQLRSRWKLV